MKKIGKILVVISLILIATMLLPLLMNANTIASAETFASPNYGDLLQYPNLDPTFCNPQRTGFNPGPAPDKPIIAWMSNETAPQIGSVTGGYHLVFGGKIFLRSQSQTNASIRYISALDAMTGQLIWQTGQPQGITFNNGNFADNAVFRIDDGHIFIEITDPTGLGNGIAVFDANTGKFLWNATIPLRANYHRCLVIPEEKLLCAPYTPVTGAYEFLVGWDMSDPSKPFTVKWNVTFVDNGYPLECYGDGKIFAGSWGDYALTAFDAKTGAIVWRVMRQDQIGYGAVYANGVLYAASESTKMIAYNATNGNIIWQYEGAGREFFVWGQCYAYGSIYAHNIGVPVGFVGRWDARTGQLLWKQPAIYQIGYLQSCVADGKMYVQQSDGSTTSGRNRTDVKFTCFDAFSGAEIWSLPLNVGQPAVAYGNLYLSIGSAGGTGTSGIGYTICIGRSTSDWTNWRGNDGTGTGNAVRQVAPANVSYPKWKYQTAGGISGSPVVGNGKVFFGSRDNSTYCINAETGEFIWKFTINARVRSAPTYSGGKLFLGPDDGNIYCLDANTGTQVWKVATGLSSEGFVILPVFQVRSSPTIIGNVLYVGSCDGKLYCLNTADGTTRWTYQTGNGILSTPAISGGKVFFTSTDNNIYCLDASSGTFQWKTLLDPATQPRACSSPAVSGSRIYVGGRGGATTVPGLYCLDVTSGTIIWAKNLLMTSYSVWSPTYANGVVYVPQDMFISAVNATDGKDLWTQFLGHETFSSVCYASDAYGGKAYVGNDAYSVTCMNATSGKPLSVFTSEGQVEGSFAIWEGKLYVGSLDGGLYCFDDAPIIATTISATVSKSSIASSESVTVSGRLSPGISNSPITLTFIKPDNSQENVTTTTDFYGVYSASYTPSTAGNYSLIVWYNGLQTVGRTYQYSYSSVVPLTVSGTTPTTQPTTTAQPTGTETTPTAEPTTTPGTGSTTDYTYIIVAVVVIIILLAIGAFVYMQRRKK